jgi:hypothetical protein
LFVGALSAELRKLKGVSVLSSDDIRLLLTQEATRQAAGCTSESCLAEIADALGADVVVSSSLLSTDKEHVLQVRRMQTHTAEAKAFERRFAPADNEEYLAALGQVVAELFADKPLRDGVTRGVSKEVGLRLNPPPLPIWSTVVVAGSAGLLAGVGAGAGGLSILLLQQAQSAVASSTTERSAAKPVRQAQQNAQSAAAVANSDFAAAAALAVTGAVMFFFTDFHGYADEG